MVISQDKDKGRFSLSTKSLEPEPGDMLKDQAGVFSQAEAMAARYHERLQAENKAREEVPPPPASARCRGDGWRVVVEPGNLCDVGRNSVCRVCEVWRGADG
jgi:hypothetical protein